MVGMDVDVAVPAHEPHQEPVLTLAAIFAAPHLADQMVGQVIEIFLAAARDDLDQPAMDAGFLAEFADRRFLGILAVRRSRPAASATLRWWYRAAGRRRCGRRGWRA